MREILFRGKRVDNGEWVHGGYMAYDCDSPFGEMVKRSNIVSYEEGDGNGFWFEVDPETVGQFTGLTDKNGTKIFEGDVVQLDDDLMVLEWDEEDLMFTLRCLDETNWITNFCITDARCLEIFGNIHENPELLTEATPCE